MQNVIPRPTATPGRSGHAGPALREHNAEILCGELGGTEQETASLDIQATDGDGAGVAEVLEYVRKGSVEEAAG
jgi:hypothetical protein